MLMPRSARMRVSLLTMPTRSSPTSSSSMPRSPAGACDASLLAITSSQARRLEAAQRVGERVGVLARHLEVHHAGELAGEVAQPARRPVGAEALRPVGQQAHDAGPVGPHHGDDERGGRRRPSSVSTTERRIIGARVAKRSSCGCAGSAPWSRAWRTTRASSARPIGASARSHSSRADLALGDEAPVLRGDRRRRPSRRPGDRPSRRRSGRLRGSSIRPRRCRDGAAAATGGSRRRRGASARAPRC